MLDDYVENELFVQMAQMESSISTGKMVRAIRDTLVTRRVNGGGGGHFADARYFFKATFALHEPLSVHLPCFNFVLCFT